VIVLSNARVFDGESAHNGLLDVAIEAERIVAIDAGLAHAEDADRIDLDGAWLMPGLVDAHLHSTFVAELDVYLRNGVTSIRYAGNPSGSVEQLRGAITSGGLRAPRILTCGPMLDSSPLSYPDYSVRVDTVEEMERAGASLLESGVDGFIVVQHVTPPLLAALVKIARPAGIPVVGQIWRMDASEAARAGISQLDNTSRVLSSPVLASEVTPADVAARIALMRQAWLEVDWEQTARLIAEMVERGVSYCPTFVRLQWVAGLGPGRLASLEADRDASAFDRESFETWAMKVAVGQQPVEREQRVRDDWARAYEAMLEWVRRFAAAGGQLVVGTDTQFGGIMLHYELANLREAGLSSVELLRVATRNSGRALGEHTRTGQVKRGWLADLLVTESDPRTDLATLRSPSLVMVGGEIALNRHQVIAR
jgi:hypothetical protein